MDNVTNQRYTHSWREYDQESCFSKKKVFALFHETVTIHSELGSVSGILILLVMLLQPVLFPVIISITMIFKTNPR